MNLKCDLLVSKLAFKFNLFRYKTALDIMECISLISNLILLFAGFMFFSVRPLYKFQSSHIERKRLVSTLEPEMRSPGFVSSTISTACV